MSTTYLNKPSSIAVNRIRFDEKQIFKDKDVLATEGIYFKFNIDDEINTTYNKLLIGPQDTPYEKGFYLFEGKFPDNYPFQPMTMRSITQGSDDGNKTYIRKHPNLYVCGKCCFSFLGTWSGPPWTPCNNAKSVAISMRSVMTKFPLENEPGYDELSTDTFDNGTFKFKKQQIHEEYAAIIKWFNIKHSVCGVIAKIDQPPYMYFKEDILSEFTKNYQYYIDTAHSLLHLDGTTIKSRVWQFIVNYNISEIIAVLKDLQNKYSRIDTSINKTSTQIINDTTIVVNDPCSKEETGSIVSTKDNISTSKVKKRSAPNGSATSFEVGYIKISENDGKKYQVSSKKRWKKYNN